MDVAIQTGRTHQIRVHAAFAGHPVAGDEKYGDKECNARLHALGLRRMFLHAASIAFRLAGRRRRIPRRSAIACRSRVASRTAAGIAPSSGLRRCERVESGGTQRLGNPDDRKADEGRRIARFDRLKQCRSQAFAAKSAGAVEGPVDLDVARNFQVGERSKTDQREINVLVHGPRPAAQKHDGRMEFDGLTAAGMQLFTGTEGVARLVVDAPRTDRDLVGTEDPGVGQACGDGGSLRMREAKRTRGRAFACDRSFVDSGRLSREADAEAGEQGGPVG